MFSGLPPIANIAQRGWHGRKVPGRDIKEMRDWATDLSAGHVVVLILRVSVTMDDTTLVRILAKEQDRLGNGG
jgi:hypothetical protein